MSIYLSLENNFLQNKLQIARSKKKKNEKEKTVTSALSSRWNKKRSFLEVFSSKSLCLHFSIIVTR